MVGTPAQHDDTLHAFHKWRLSSEAQLPGVGGPDLETVCPFIPRSNLEDYFQRPGQLENLLTAVRGSDAAVDPNYVRDHYLQSFATLLCIGQGHLIYHFQQYNSLRDSKLPHRAQPDDFPFTKPEIFEEFKNAQWQFCASKLEYGMNDRFKEEDILPIIRKEEIGQGGSAIIYRIVVDAEYNSLRPRGSLIPDRRHQHKNTFVLKTYRAAEAEENYKAERDAYMKLRWAGTLPPHIIAYYGGFVHNNSYNIILEYADQGTLEDFMRNTKSPSSIEDTLLLWDRLSDITHGLMTIHGNIGHTSSASQIFNGIHQDIKPTNILVFSGNGTSPYDCHFKIADLGLAHFKPITSQPSDLLDLDAFGTRAYGAPETFRSHRDMSSTPLQITKDVDIWSIGCVFSEVAVWAHHGWKRVVEYRRQRKAEVEAAGGGEGEHVFHFDGKLLDAVNNIHEDMLGRKTAKDLITRSVLDRLVTDMLQHNARPNAMLVSEKSKRLIKYCETKYEVSLEGLVGNTNGEPVGFSEPRTSTKSPRRNPHHNYHSHTERETSREKPLPPDEDSAPPSPSSVSQPRHRHHHNSTGQSNEPRSISAIESSQSSGQSSQGVINPPPPPSAAADPHEISSQHVQQHQKELVRPTLSINEGHAWKDAIKKGGVRGLPGDENLTSLDQRDHIFLIDNSATMKQHKDQIERVISLLAYMLKNSDKDGLDIFFTQTVTKVNSRKSSKISNSIHQEPFKGITDMRGRLQTILQEHIDKFGTMIQPPRSKYGRRPPPHRQRPLSFYILTDAKWQLTDVGGLIKDLVHSMIAKGCPKEHVAIQFIRLGDDEASIRKLDELDHGLGLKDSGMDIVDHTYWDGNVWKQLLGALNDWYDDDPT